MGEMPKQLPSVGMYAVVMGVGDELHPAPEKMLKGMAERRVVSTGAGAGAAEMVVAARTRVASVVVNCIVSFVWGIELEGL
jgi:hypothetical protein